MHKQVVRMASKFCVYLLLLLFAVQVTPVADNDGRPVTVWESAVRTCVQKIGFYVEDLKLQYMAMAKDESKVGVWCLWYDMGREFSDHSSLRVWACKNIYAN